MGGTGTGESFKNSYLKLKNIKVIMRTIHDATEPILTTKLWGKELSFPCLGAPITGTKFNMGGGVTEEEYCLDVIGGAIDAGTIGMMRRYRRCKLLYCWSGSYKNKWMNGCCYYKT